MLNEKVVRIICWSAAVVLLLSILVLVVFRKSGIFAGIFRGSLINDEEGFVLGDSYYVPADIIESINVEWISGKVFIEPYDGRDIAFEEKASRKLESDEKLVYEVRNGTLYIKFFESRGVSFFSEDSISKFLTVRIPYGLAGDLKDLQISSVSGAIIANDLKSKNTFIESTSGDIRLAGFVSEEIGVNCTSGAVDLEGSFDEVRIAVVSGNITVTGTSCPRKVTMVSVSGNAELRIPENEGFDVEFDNVSGSFTCEFPIVIEKDGGTYKDGGASISMETVSGDLAIKRIADQN